MKRIGFVATLMVLCFVAVVLFRGKDAAAAQVNGAIFPLQVGKSYEFTYPGFGVACHATIVSPPGPNGWAIVDITQCPGGPSRGRVALNVNPALFIASRQ